MQKIRIFELAKKWKMESEDLVKACAEIGIIVKCSALASISPEEKEKVLFYLSQWRNN